ncbi:cation:proton antiporter [Streptomyces sp. NPDC090798]|uniref:cation:proton antiporter domain-containing protein n=1 Tax=Streptomyces sp. NPDC090798 TaxID=3365968 RepID=UPI0037F99F99
MSPPLSSPTCPPELLHVSGVLAVVICGLVTTRFGPRVLGSDARIQAVAFWEVASYLLNGALFILVGIQLPAAVRALTSVSLAQAALAACAVSVAVIGTRLLWFYSVPYLVRSWTDVISGGSAVSPPLSACRWRGRGCAEPFRRPRR